MQNLRRVRLKNDPWGETCFESGSLLRGKRVRTENKRQFSFRALTSFDNEQIKHSLPMEMTARLHHLKKILSEGLRTCWGHIFTLDCCIMPLIKRLSSNQVRVALTSPLSTCCVYSPRSSRLCCDWTRQPFLSCLIIVQEARKAFEVQSLLFPSTLYWTVTPIMTGPRDRSLPKTCSHRIYISIALPHIYS